MAQKTTLSPVAGSAMLGAAATGNPSFPFASAADGHATMALYQALKMWSTIHSATPSSDLGANLTIRMCALLGR